MSHSSSGSSAEHGDLSHIEWHWSEAPTVNETHGAEGRYVFTPARGSGEATIAFAPAGHGAAWTHALAGIPGDAACLLVDGNRLYVALYLRAATGCTVIALDTTDGRELWRRRLEGVGSMAHSRYANRVQCALQRGLLVIYGEESVARYIEVLEPTDGRQVFHRRIDR